MSTPTDDEVRRRYGLPPGARVVRPRPDALGRVTVEPDAFAVVTLDSALEWAAWDRPVAVSGTSARLSVQGTFVGEGAPVHVDVTDARGRRLARADGQMHRDVSTVEIALPRDAEGVAIAVARIPDLGLEVASGPLVVLPWIELSPRWERDGRPARCAHHGETVSLVVDVDARRDLLPELEGVPVHLAVRSGSPPVPVVELRGVVRDREVRVEWLASMPTPRLEIVRQGALDRAADRAGLPRGEPPYRYERPAFTFEAWLHTARALSPELPVADTLTLSVADVSTGTAAAGRAVDLVWPDGSTEELALDADGRLTVGEAPPGPVEVVVALEEGAGAPATGDVPDDADVVADVPAVPGRGHVALVPTGQHTHLRLLPFVLSP